MKSIFTSIAALVFTSGALFTYSPAVDAQGSQVLRCGASRGQEAFCPADTRNGVTLVRQLSRAGCWEGKTWGTSRRGIWVANGCRADFAVAERYVTRRQVYTDAPSSNSSAAALALGILGIAGIAANQSDNRYDNYNRYSRDRYGRYHDQYWTSYDSKRPQLVRCESEDNQFRACRTDARRGVEIYRQISRTPCRFRANWGYDARGIWVDRGCAADFVVRR